MRTLLLALAAFGLAPLLPAQKLEVIRVRPNIYMVASAAGNVTVQVGTQPGNDGVLLVDTYPANLTDALLAEIRKISDRPIRYILNTSADADHTGGNLAIAKIGRPVAAFSNGGLTQDTAAILSQDNVLIRMSSPKKGDAALPSGAWPILTFIDKRDFYFNGEPIQLIAQPAAHTDGDMIVFFRNSNVIAAGDVFNTLSYPVIDVERGGSIQGEVDALNRLLDLAIPENNEEGGTMVIPGHGRLCDQADLSDYRDMITIIRDRIQDGIKKGKSLQQIKAAQPTLDWDARYSKSNWTGDMFVEAAYKSLAGKK